MDQSRLLHLFRQTPSLNLDLIRLARELTRPDGSLDLETAITKTDELNRAQGEAQAHMRAASELVERIRWNIQLLPD